MAVRTDVHQHLWGPAFVTALRHRTAPPRLDGWVLHLPGRPPYAVDPARHDLSRRTRQARADGLDRVLVSLSAPLGIESLPPDEAAPLLDAHHADALALPPPFSAWAAAGLAEIDPDALARRLDEGFAGLQLPATALLDAAGHARCAPLLALLEERGLPLFVHPGPVAGPVAASGALPADATGPGAPPPGPAPPGPTPPAPGPAGHPTAGGYGRPPAPPPTPPEAPGWWDAVVPYVQQMHAAWFAFRSFGRPRHPRLRVCFALLAGLAPLHGERLAARGGGRGTVDRNAFAETSSYGPRAVDATIRALGIDTIVLGSDRPYAGPAADFGLGAAAEHAIRVTNPERLCTGKE